MHQTVAGGTVTDASQETARRPRGPVRRAATVLLWYGLPAIALVAVCAYILGAVYWHANPPVVPVAGVSMRPTLQPGDLVFLKGVDPSKLRKGDIVAVSVPKLSKEKYSLPPNLVHRIVKIETSPSGLLFHTKGDANANEDVFITNASDIVGREVARAPGLGYPFLFFRARQGKIFLAALVLVAVLYFLIGLFEERRAYVEGTAVGLQLVLDETEELKRLVGAAERAAPHDGRAPPSPGWPSRPDLLPLPPVGGYDMVPLASRDPMIERLADEVRVSSERSAESADTMRQLLAAVAEYGEHLRSHTAVMQGLAQTTGELQRAATELRSTLVDSPPAAPAQPLVEESPPSPEQPAAETAEMEETPAARVPVEVPPVRAETQPPRRQETVAIDPTELRQPGLERTLRGYARDDVERLLERAAAALEEARRERDELRGQLERAEQMLANYRQLEASMSQALIAVEQNANDLRAQAQREVELLLEEARLKSREILQEAAGERERLLADARGVRSLLQAALGALDDRRLAGGGTPAPGDDQT